MTLAQRSPTWAGCIAQHTRTGKFVDDHHAVHHHRRRTYLERLAARLPASRFALIITVGDDAPAILTVVPRDNPSHPMDVAVVDLADGTYFAAYTEGGRLLLEDVTSPGSTAEAIEWTLMGR